MATSEKVISWLRSEIAQIRESGMYKHERVITSRQDSAVTTEQGRAINMCANNYLGLAGSPEVIEAAGKGLQERGFGMASVRFICGTQDLHKTLEQRLARFLGTADAILYTSCFDANTGLFETLLGTDDCVISDSLNHASIIDGIRLCKAQRKIYQHLDMGELESRLKEAAGCRFRMIATDGAFSMHGDLAPLAEICALADKYDALVMVDDSHATGLIGPAGRGTPEHFGVQERVDIVTSTLGKAMGGASGGFTAGRAELVDLLRQRSRPYLFSNSVAPAVVAGSLKALEILEERPELVRKLAENTRYFREKMTGLGFKIKPGIHPIVPIVLGDEKVTASMAHRLNEQGVFVVGFSYPVVPKGEARIRVQISAAHNREQLDYAIEHFALAGAEQGVIQARQSTNRWV